MEEQRTLPGWKRRMWQGCGLAAFGTGTVGIFVPLLPTVVFYIIAAACFARSNPAWEARLVRHPRFGPHIIAWRERRAIARVGKWGATLGLAGSSVVALGLLADPWRWLPGGIGLIVLAWIWSRPDA